MCFFNVDFHPKCLEIQNQCAKVVSYFHAFSWPCFQAVLLFDFLQPLPLLVSLWALKTALSTEWPVPHNLWQLLHYIPAVKQLYYNSWIVGLSFYLSLLRVTENWSQLRHRTKMYVDFGPCLYQSDLTLQLFICVITVFRSSWHGAAAMLLQHQEDFFYVLKDLQPGTDRQTGRQSGGSRRQINHFPAVSCQSCQLSCVSPQHKSHLSWHCQVTKAAESEHPTSTRHCHCLQSTLVNCQDFLPVEWELSDLEAVSSH